MVYFRSQAIGRQLGDHIWEATEKQVEGTSVFACGDRVPSGRQLGDVEGEDNRETIGRANSGRQLEDNWETILRPHLGNIWETTGRPPEHPLGEIISHQLAKATSVGKKTSKEPHQNGAKIPCKMDPQSPTEGQEVALYSPLAPSRHVTCDRDRASCGCLWICVSTACLQALGNWRTNAASHSAKAKMG
jgi:hypothetical protein